MRQRKMWDRERMVAAINAVRKKEMGYFKAAQTFGVPQTTLERYVKSKEHPDKLIATPLGRKPTLPEEIEENLVELCLEFEKRFFGVTMVDLRALAFSLCRLNGIPSTFSQAKEMAGYKWLKSFLKRHKKLSVRRPQGLSMARASGFTKQNVMAFFDIYEPEYSKFAAKPNRIYNVDETGITIVQHKHTKVKKILF